MVKTYKPFDEEAVEMGDGRLDGFTAISYIAVDREGTSSMISVKRLKEQLGALYDNGYVTVTQKDILAFYQEGKPLPKKALFLMYEDGRRDTAIFAQKLMEKYNYRGTMLSYADKFDNRDSKFLTPKDLLNLRSSSYWELGTNGYRLSYINVFDRYNNYLGELNSPEYIKLRRYLGRNYNQYLMDYIRDAYGVPRESYDEMKERISRDYLLMQDIYTRKLEGIPEVYVLMHSNTGSFANNENVSKINEDWMTRLFSMNFNREGYSYNTRENSIYDLTRMQPQPYWYPNHLLMKIRDDSKADIQFVEGDADRAAGWKTVRGAAQYQASDIILTSEPKSNGLLQLKQSGAYSNLTLSLTMSGNKIGSQSVYLRADEELKHYIKIQLQNNYLFIKEDGKELYRLNLDEFDGIEVKSVEEDALEALQKEYNVYKDGSGSFGQKTSMQEQKDPKTVQARTAEEDAQPYIPDIQINEAGLRKLEILLEGDKLSVKIDGRIAAEQLDVTETKAGFVYLESAWGEYGYSQKNIADDVYDGVFRDLVVRDGQDAKLVLYDNRLHGLDKAGYRIKTGWGRLINWFIKVL